MSYYDYTDSNYDTLRVISGPGNNVRLLMLDNTSCWVTADDAPAVALAILEAAGHPLRTYQPGEVRDLADVAHDALKRHLTYQEEQAAREAEDLKVADFFTKFDGLTPAFINDHDRRRYRAARKFFEEA